MPIPPLTLPEIPSYYRLPDYLETELAAAFQLRDAITATLAAQRGADPSFAGFIAETKLEIALACAKLASSYAVCQVQDWLDEIEP